MMIIDKMAECREIAPDKVSYHKMSLYFWGNRVLALLLLLFCLTLGGNKAWGQTDYSGMYYIMSASACKSPNGDYYLCPTENWAFFHAVSNVNKTNNGQPFLTTHIMDSGDEAKYKWIVEKHTIDDHDYYAFKYGIDYEGGSRYLSYNRQLTGAGVDRMRLHLEKTESPGDYELFDITLNGANFVISPKKVDEDDNGYKTTPKYLVVNGGNTNYYEGKYKEGGGVSNKTGGPSGFGNTTGIIGTYKDKNDANNPFNLVIPSPAISQDQSSRMISISCEFAGVTIRYTTDGTEPTATTSTLYEGEFLPEIGTSVVKAKAFNNSNGDVASATGSFNLPKNAAPSISVDMGTKMATISTTVAGGTIYYTKDGSNPTVSSSEYTGPISFTMPTTIKAIVGKVGYAPSTVTTKAIIKVGTPQMYDNGNAAIAITSATVGASIYYTVDGTTPSRSSSLYSEPLTNMEGKTIKAFAVKAECFDSDVSTFGPVSFSCAQPIIKRTGANSFTLTCSNPKSGVTIYYTTDGDTPSTSDSHVASGGTVTFSASQLPFTVKAMAVANGFVNSPVASLTISNDGLSGSGTSADPYQIALDSDYSKFATKVAGGEASACFIVTSNINASGTAEITTPFTGTFDGDGYTISNLGHALFNTIDGGTVKNVMLDAVSISGGTNAGAIANKVTGTSTNKAAIYNCGVLSGSVSGSGYVGSIVGQLGDSNDDNCYARVINCFSYATIGGGSQVGGIVGYNDFASASNNLRTMVMNCMFYGKITGGSNKAPIYNGENITNVGEYGLANYNYYYSGCTFTGGIDTYNCALAADERYLTRFEFYRRMLNSNGELAAWYATGSTANRSEMYKWILLPSSYGTEHPFPVLAPQGIYPSVVNIDADNAEDIDENNEHRNEGRKLSNMGGTGTHKGQLAVTIRMGSQGNAPFGAPNGAGIKSGKTFPVYLNITDKDALHYNFNYGKVQLPYYNEYCTGNCSGNRVVTGWKIVSIEGGTAGNYSTGDDVTFTNGELTATPYNFADRKCTDKDLYSVSERIFSQGAYWDVPDGVTAITIEPYWGKAAYLCDKYWNVVYKQDHTVAYDVTPMGVHYTNGNDYFIEGTWQKVYNSLDNAYSALSSNANNKVYDYAVVLVGNYHLVKQANSINNDSKPFTVMSADFDKDNEPDYSFILQFSSRQNTAPIRFDFINIPGLGMAQKSYGAQSMPNVGIFKPNGWFEITNTATILLGQFEYDRKDKVLSPLILHGGIIEQIVSNNDGTSPLNKTQYMHLGSNVWFANFSPGIHQDKTTATKHVPVSVTGGEYDEFHLTGTYRADATISNDNAECYIHGGKFGEITGTGLEGIGTTNDNGNITWVIDQADITNFFGGGINAAKPSLGNIYTEITNSHVTLFCGGPKFGDMQSGKTVTTKATDCTFGTFFGAGYGGNSYNRFSPRNKVDDVNYDWNAWVNEHYTCAYSSAADKNGISTNFDYEFIPMSGGMSTNVARLFVNYLSFSLATTGSVTSTLTGCKVTGNFYGGGSLGKVSGDATSTLTNCTLEQNAFGAGFSATLPTVEVMETGRFKTEPEYDPDGGVYSLGDFPDTKTYTWQHATSPSIDKNNKILYTTEDLTTLGTVTGKATLTINGTTTVGKSVYGGGEESAVGGDTEVYVNGGTIGTADLGGADYGNVYGGGMGKADDKDAGLVKGNTNVNISGSATSPFIYHNVYGGGAYGSVGTFTTYDAKGMPTAATENTGVCHVTITGGKIGTTGQNNGMVFGSSRGDVASPVNGVDPNDPLAWVYDTYVTIGDVTKGVDNNGDGKFYDYPLIKGSVYGSGENGHTLHNTDVKVHSGTIGIASGEEVFDTNSGKTYDGPRYPYRGNVYGGGCGTDTYETEVDGGDDESKKYTFYNFNAGIVRGNSSVTMDGGHVLHNVYGGGAMGSVGTYSTDESGNVTCGEGTGKCIVTISGGDIGGDDMKMKPDTGKKPANEPDDYGHVFGAGRGEAKNPDIYQNIEEVAYYHDTEVTIKGTAFVRGSVYGGSESGHVLNNTHVVIEGECQIGNGNGVNSRYSSSDWENPTSGTLKPTNHWDYVDDGAPYDQYADENGKYGGQKSAEGGNEVATDGHTFYGNVFGGGSGYYPYAQGEWLFSAGKVGGNTWVEIKGGHILNNVYGGCEMSDVAGSATIGMTGGTIGVPRSRGEIEQNPSFGHIFGAGMGDKRIFFNTVTNVQSTQVTVSGGRVYGSVFGGGEDGHVLKDAETTISGDVMIGTNEKGEDIEAVFCYDGNVFGGGQGSPTALTAGTVGGNVKLNIEGGRMLGSVYGGGRIASVGTYFAMTKWENPETGEVEDNPLYGKMQADTLDQNIKHGWIDVNLKGGTVDYNVYGGCMGTLTGLAAVEYNRFAVSKNITVKLNEGKDEDDQGCVVKGSIYGCNNVNSSPQGEVNVYVYATQNAAASQIAGTVTGEGAVEPKVFGRYDVKGVYGGGNMAAYLPKGPDADETGDYDGDNTEYSTHVYISGCKLTSIYQVYGGGNAASTPATEVTVDGAYEIKELFGGGNGMDKISHNGKDKIDNPGANVGYKAYDKSFDPPAKSKAERAQFLYGTGVAAVNIYGGVLRCVFGGSNTKGNVRETAVTLLEEGTDCAFQVDEVYGGGKSAPMDAEAKLLMECIPGLKRAYGGAEAADIQGGVTLNITNGTFDRVFGGNNISGTIRGPIKINIEETGCRPVIIGELYGGGNLAGYSIYGYKDVNDAGQRETDSNGNTKWFPRRSDSDAGTGPTEAYDSPEVNVKSFTSIGNIYGGGYGSTAVMVGSPTVNINVAMGDQNNHDGAEIDENAKTPENYPIPSHEKGKIGAINNVFGGGNEAPVIGDTHVNIGTEETVLFKTPITKTVKVDGVDKEIETTDEERTKTVVGADIRGNVYGGGNQAEVTGNTNVTIGKETTTN